MRALSSISPIADNFDNEYDTKYLHKRTTGDCSPAAVIQLLNYDTDDDQLLIPS